MTVRAQCNGSIKGVNLREDGLEISLARYRAHPKLPRSRMIKQYVALRYYHKALRTSDVGCKTSPPTMFSRTPYSPSKVCMNSVTRGNETFSIGQLLDHGEPL
ncbi:hypothetical protein PAXRUDRAFT_244775 [Paxillus rubicundulus Ve08.2h10]|uniref:Uncharacterized protein n=1 Tax=Paxillus rubicundulus Ve08.2h10 TaxID=930991 RepID=A0A0D0DGR0_9AGAM|nr:hypothetical protein PAXRUDRAFT_244775 [Paxillus rubicundulus Ve08.2h10]